MEDMKKEIEEVKELIDKNVFTYENDKNVYGTKGASTILYEQGYRKIDKDSVVFSREEYNKLLKVNSELAVLEKSIPIIKEQASKETAEKIFNGFLSVLQNNRQMGNNFVVLTASTLYELAKQFGVEIKE